MSDRITIRFSKSEGALIRLVGLVERKGWEVRAVTMPESVQDGPAEMHLSLAPRDETRTVDVLSRHIVKMHDVTDVEITSASRVLEQS